MFEKILIVCVGNICRSPTAEILFKQKLPHKQIASAGLHALVGHNIDSKARGIVEKHGINVQQHTAQQFSSELGREYDLILVMEKRHRDEIASRFPECLAKTMLLNHWLGGKDIPDPYKKSDEVFEQIYTMLTKATDSWVAKLQ